CVFSAPATSAIYTLSLHDALPILCGMCGHRPTCARTHEGQSPRLPATQRVHPRAYECPHIPHIPHTPTATSDSGISHPAQVPAHPAHSRARAFLSSYPVQTGVGEG